MRVIACVLFLVLASAVKVVLGNVAGKCPTSMNMTFNLECSSCKLTPQMNCPDGTIKLTENEGISCDTYDPVGSGRLEKGCQHTCEKTLTIDQCCVGFWGTNCDECPGGIGSVCSGHGACSDLINGTGQCTCQAGWTGYSCESCTNTTNCTSDFNTDLSKCGDVKCPNNSVCMKVDEEPLCVCTWPYVEKDEDTSQEEPHNTTTACKQIDTCKVAPFCHSNATCQMTNTSGTSDLWKICTCQPGNHGDGFQCDPDDPCQVNNGGCDVNTTYCVYDSPGKSHCDCKDGYHEYVLHVGCYLIDICRVNTTICNPKATCKTVAPYQVRCTCMDGYTGDGYKCFGNLLQSIKDLDESHPVYKGKLTLIQGALEKYYSEPITQYSTAFTMFVPIDEAFRAIETGDYQQWLQDEFEVKRILRDHMIFGWFDIFTLTNLEQFYTLQGSDANIKINSGSYQLSVSGISRKAKVLLIDVLASNGVIHVIDSLVFKTVMNSDKNLDVHYNLKKNGQFNRLESLIASLGASLGNLLTRPNITVFAPVNKAWDSLPNGALTYLASTEGRGHLISILENHVYEGILDMPYLVKERVIKSVAGIASYVNTRENTGRVQINYVANITKAASPASNGIIHEVDDINVPVGSYVLPSRCDLYRYIPVEGPCGDCRESPVCYSPDVKTDETRVCRYWTEKPDGQYEKVDGCLAVCNRTMEVPRCCDGYYGYDCLPCPGEYQNPCNGRGKCDDGYLNSGVCQCDDLYSGEACNQCADDKKYGTNCDQDCECVHGHCNNGLGGDGKCSQCIGPYTGDLCNYQIFTCSDFGMEFLQCHYTTDCVVDERTNTKSCVCKPGYYQNSTFGSCTPINVCLRPDRGGCNLQASCTMTGPGTANCTCHPGYHGDGTECQLKTECIDNRGCQENAECVRTSPGQYICLCRKGFEANGTMCLSKNRCEVNNGGCDPEAVCSHEDKSSIYVNCTCPREKGLTGNGFHCYGNLIDEMMKLPNMSLMQSFYQFNTEHEQVQAALKGMYTLFLPNDGALVKYWETDHLNRSYWMKTENAEVLFNYHMISDVHSLSYLMKESSIKRLDTMADGFSITVLQGSDGVMRVCATQWKGSCARVVQSDVLASNGYINVIDTVLEPYEPVDPENYPTLSDFLAMHDDYSTFAGWMKDKGVLDELDKMKMYTLYIPNNQAALTFNRTVTKAYLASFINPGISLMYTKFYDTSEVATVFGKTYKWQFTEDKTRKMKFLVNGVRVLKADMFTFKGVVNEIDGMFTPMFNNCDTQQVHEQMGPCLACGVDAYPCSGNSTTKMGDAVFNCTYREKINFSKYDYRAGCQKMCYTTTNVKGCCAGYFGNNCDDCPGGPESPCNNHGVCNDGSQGNGLCLCDYRFIGPQCDRCIPGWAGTNCDIDKLSCRYQNGGCDVNAYCSDLANGTRSCSCKQGFQGNGYKCIGPCDTNNGGCHDNATCGYSASSSIMCQCRTGLAGDGKEYCNGDILSTLSTLSSASAFYKNIMNYWLSGDLTGLYLNKSAKSNFTLFVPVDSSLSGKILSAGGVLSQIIQSATPVWLHGVDFQNTTVTSLSNNTLAMTYSGHDHIFYVNDSKVLEGNIPCSNGVIHLMSKPFSQAVLIDTLTNGRKGSASGSVWTIVGPVLAFLVMAILVVVVIVMYRHYQTGYWSLLQTWMSHRKEDGDTVSTVGDSSPLHTDDRRESTSGLPSPSNTNFGNPLFQEFPPDDTN